MPVHLCTHMYIKGVPTLGYFPFSEAQVLTILWASTLSLPFYLKVDLTWNNVASDAIFYIIFSVCCLVHHSSTDDLRLLRFPEVLFGSPGHDLHLSSITLNLLSPQLSFFTVLKCDLFVIVVIN